MIEVPRHISKPKVFGVATGLVAAFALLTATGLPPQLIFSLLVFAAAAMIVYMPGLQEKLYNAFSDEGRVLFSISLTERPAVTIRPEDRDVTWEEAVPLIRSGKLIYHGIRHPEVIAEILRRIRASDIAIPFHEDPVRPGDMLLTAYVCRLEESSGDLTADAVRRAHITFRLFRNS